MNAVFKRVIFSDVVINRKSMPRQWWKKWAAGMNSLFSPTPVSDTVEVTNYALGFMFEPTSAELEQIRKRKLFGQPAITLPGRSPMFFSDVLGPDFVPEVNPSQVELLKVEGRVREAAATWTLFFENLSDEF